MYNDKEAQMLTEAYEQIINEAAGKNCKRCGTPMRKHDDPEKAKKGYKNCPKCNLTFSPEATVKGSYAMMDGEGKIKTGVHKEAYQTLPPIDRERYTPIPDLEGPFMMLSGKVVYYDPKEGKYYDRDSDMYMDYDEMTAHQTPRDQHQA